MALSDHSVTDSNRHRSHRRERHAIRAFLLVVIVFLLLAHPHHSRLPVLIPALSPVITVASWLTTRTLLATSWIGLLIVLFVILRKRAFCRWVCPTGTCADGSSWIGMRAGRRCPRMPAVGSWVLLITMGGALLGIPWLLWLDPLALFSGMFGVVDLETIPYPGWAAMGMGVVLAVSWIWPGVWCSHLCPLGAFQDLTYRAVRGRLPAARSPEDEVPGEPAAEPEAASHLTWPESGSPAARMPAPSGPRISRRLVFGLGLGALAGFTARRLSATNPACLRPPGAAREDRFVHLCIRCGNCLRACPTDIIRPDHGDSGVLGLLTPTLQLDEDYCREDCTQCTLVCPSGALMPITQMAGKAAAIIGRPHVDMDLCLLGDDRECSKCRNWCPFDAITLQFSEEEYTLVPQVDLAKCPGCGACQAACPTSPHKAIVVHPAP